MTDMDRRSMLAISIAASTVVFPSIASAQGAGKQLAPGVTQIDFGERDSELSPILGDGLTDQAAAVWA